MKKVVNGVYYDMTAEDIAEMERLTAQLPPVQPSEAERIAALEEDNVTLKKALELLLSGEVE